MRDKARRVSRTTKRYGFSSYIDLLAYAFMTVVDLDKHEPSSYKKSYEQQEIQVVVKCNEREIEFLE